jgi:hypothetical protein
MNRKIFKGRLYHGNSDPSRYCVSAARFELKTYEALLAGTFYLYHEFVYEHVWVEVTYTGAWRSCGLGTLYLSKS